MTGQERAFRAAARASARALPRIQRDTLGEIIRQLRGAQASILTALAAHPSESAQRRLRQMQQEVEKAMHDFQRAATLAANGGADAAWRSGITGITAPLDAAGVSILGPRVDGGLLMAAKRLMTDRIADISVRTVDRLNATLMQNLIGTQSMSDTITGVQRILGGAARSRAMTVAYTEIGRVHSGAQQDAMQAASDTVPNLKKRWQKSGKLHPRLTHVEADGQTVPVAEPYIIDGEQLMYPRDPNGSAGNTINCGCLSIPVLDAASLAAAS